MGKIYGNFKDGIFYHCAAIDKDFTSEEWYKYCDDTRYSDAIVATYFGFQWAQRTRPRKMLFWQIWNGSRYEKTTPRKSKTQSTRQYLIGSVSN